MKYFFGLLICFSLSNSAFSQAIRNFTADPVKFPEEMERFLTETNKKEGEKIMGEFHEVWQPGHFSGQQQEAIYRTANSMLRKHMKAFPDFVNYLSALINFAMSNQPAERFDAWQKGLDKLLLLPPRYFNRFVDVSIDLFKSNSLYISPAVRWYADNVNYTFETDSLPKVLFPKMTLICSSRGDSSIITNTEGVYYPNTELFYGHGGEVSWVRAGWDAKSVNAKLSNYVVNVTKAEYHADSVLFTNATYFDKPLLGKFGDKILADVKPENASYPRFESYQVEFAIKNIVPDVDYRGGFSMIGSRMVGSGNKEEDALLFFHRKGVVSPFLTAASKAFVVRKDKITADRAAVTIYWEKDSVYHSGVTFKYIVKDRELALIRGEEGKSQSPYYDSYHNLEMYFDGLYWKIDDPIIEFKMISGVGESKAVFESSNYFRQNRYQKMQGLSMEHPLYTIKKFAEKNKTKIIYTDEFAKYLHMAPAEVRVLIINLSDQGFLIYDPDEDKALIKDKLYYYLLASIGKTDYDVMRLESTIKSKPNASINLLNFEMTMRGVAPFILSDSQDVVIFPKDQEIHIQKDRDLTFAGRIKAGRLDFFGKNFAFNYDNFKIDLDNVDSLRLKVETDSLDQMGRKKLVAVRSVLQNITGDLLIDFKGNKSGLKDYPQYPIFNSKKDSYVYYDKPYIQEGVYEKDKFYFHLDPFTIDSLDNFSRSRLRFGGEFVSAGIFQDFRDTLRLQPDLSLGLVKNTADAGWPAYGGKGTFTNKISLSNDGLIGDGKVDYLASTTKSDRLIFLPDSMNTDAKEFTNRKTIYGGVEFPDVAATDVYEHWMPKQDVMYIYKKTEPINMYEKQSTLAGNLQLRPEGMQGNGMMSFSTAELESHLFKYKQNTFDADTSDFRLTSDDIHALAFATNNVHAHIDFVQQVGDFKSNGGGSFVKFPLNQYICYIDQFKWYMKDKEIEMSSSKTARQTDVDTSLSGVNLEGSEFISVEPTQDSLRFRAPFAKYSLKDYLIKAYKVAFIQTADASVIPDSGKVIVERYAKMQTLTNARIIANNTTKYHTVYNASVDIQGRKKYEGSGDYDYIDENKNRQHFHFDKISVDTTFQTVANTEITDTAGFPLSTMFLFKGGVSLRASQQHLIFSGFAKPNLRCDSVEKNWIRFSSEVDPDNVMIPIETPTTDNGVKLISGIIQSNSSRPSENAKGIYATFLGPKLRASDSTMIQARGFLSYSKTFDEFRITTKEKMDKATVPGNLVSFNDKKCILYAEGRLNFNADFGQVNLQTIGNAIHNWNNDSTDFDLLMALDFYFNDDALKTMTDYFTQNATLKATQDNGRLVYEKGINELAGKEKAEKLITEMNLYGSFKKMPDELRHTLFFTDVKMRWDNYSKSFKSKGMIGLGSMEKVSINRYVKGNIEIIHKKAADIINIYLEPENQTWYYFSYSRGLMQAISSQSSFNDAINKVKPEKRANKEKDKPNYEYILSTDRAVKNFLKKFSAEPQPEEEGGGENKGEEK